MVSCIITTRNAGERISKLLDRISPVATEIILVDTGSTDKTLEIASKKQAKVFQTPFEQDYAKIKNFGIAKATDEWIFVIDADELPSMELIDALPTLVKTSSVDGFWFKRRNYYTPTKYFRYGVLYPDYQLRLFRNRKGYHYTEAVHEKLNIPQNLTQEVPYDLLHAYENSKYRSLANYADLIPYVNIQAVELRKLGYSPTRYLFTGIGKSCEIFLEGYYGAREFLMELPGYGLMV